MKVLKNPKAKTPHKQLIWANNVSSGHRWAVREGDWKLLGNPKDSSNKGPITKDDKLFLVNMKEDASEMTNIASAHPEKVKQLEKIYLDWKKSLVN